MRLETLFTKQFVKRRALEQVAEGKRLIAIATPPSRTAAIAGIIIIVVVTTRRWCTVAAAAAVSRIVTVCAAAAARWRFVQRGPSIIDTSLTG